MVRFVIAAAAAAVAGNRQRAVTVGPRGISKIGENARVMNARDQPRTRDIVEYKYR